MCLRKYEKRSQSQFSASVLEISDPDVGFFLTVRMNDHFLIYHRGSVGLSGSCRGLVASASHLQRASFRMSSSDIAVLYRSGDANELLLSVMSGS